MKKARLLLTLSLVLTFAAGVALGCLLERGHRSSHRPGGPRSWLARELDLTPEQEQQMRAIWSELRPPSGEGWGALREEREQAVRALLTEEQELQYDQILAEHERRRAALDDEARAAERQAVGALLTEEQKPQYDQILAEYERKVAGLAAEAQANLEQAVARTKEILTPEQRAKYDEMLNWMRERGRRGSPGAGMRPSESEARPPGRRPHPEHTAAGP